MAETGQTIIIKKINKGKHAPHGGAWKVAYADFVTAMMAFFLLMWLLNATEAESLSGLADYFAPTVGIKDNMGIGFRGGKGALSKGIGADKNTNKGIIFGGTPAGPIVKVMERIEQETEEPDDEKVMLVIGQPGTTKFQGKEDKITYENLSEKSLSEIAPVVESYVNEALREGQSEATVAMVETPEGLELQIRDVEGRSMFMQGTSQLTENSRKSLRQLAGVLKSLPNFLAITGHTSSVPVRGEEGYSNWELSADRANVVRQFLLQSGVQPEQIERVVGKADNSPMDPKHPASEVNNRISIILLRNAALAEHKLAAPGGVFIDPSSQSAKEINDDQPQEDTEEMLEEGQPVGDKKPAAVQQESSEAVNKHLLDETKLSPEELKEFEEVPAQDPFLNGQGVNPLRSESE